MAIAYSCMCVYICHGSGTTTRLSKYASSIPAYGLNSLVLEAAEATKKRPEVLN